MPVFLECFADDCTRHPPELAASHVVTVDQLVDVKEQVHRIRNWLNEFIDALTEPPEVELEALVPPAAVVDSNDPGPIPECLVRRQQNGTT